jgi:hypothetical protein
MAERSAILPGLDRGPVYGCRRSGTAPELARGHQGRPAARRRAACGPDERDGDTHGDTSSVANPGTYGLSHAGHADPHAGSSRDPDSRCITDSHIIAGSHTVADRPTVADCPTVADRPTASYGHAVTDGRAVTDGHVIANPHAIRDRFAISDRFAFAVGIALSYRGAFGNSGALSNGAAFSDGASDADHYRRRSRASRHADPGPFFSARTAGGVYRHDLCGIHSSNHRPGGHMDHPQPERFVKGPDHARA